MSSKNAVRWVLIITLSMSIVAVVGNMVTLSIIGGLGNLGAAVWYIWKKKNWKLGFLHVGISAVSFRILSKYV